MASHKIRNREWYPERFRPLLIGLKEASYPLPMNLLSKDFDPIAVNKQNSLEKVKESRSIESRPAERMSSEAG